MRLYIIGIMVGAVGLVAANQVRAEARCEPVSGTVPAATQWNLAASILVHPSGAMVLGCGAPVTHARGASFIVR